MRSEFKSRGQEPYQRSNGPIILLLDFYEHNWFTDGLTSRDDFLKIVRTPAGFAVMLSATDRPLSKGELDSTPIECQLSYMYRKDSDGWARLVDADRQVYELRGDGKAYSIGYLTYTHGDRWDYQDEFGKWEVSK